MLKDNQQKIQAALAPYEKQLKPKQYKLLQEAMEKMAAENVPLKNVMGITPEIEEALYISGHNLFQNGKYKEALKIFRTLREFDNTYRYNFAIAAAHQYLGEYMDAIGTYLICTQIEPENPMPYFHLYDCCLKNNNRFFAAIFLQGAIKLAEKNPIHAKLKERAQLEFEQFKQ